MEKQFIKLDSNQANNLPLDEKLKYLLDVWIENYPAPLTILKSENSHICNIKGYICSFNGENERTYLDNSLTELRLNRSIKIINRSTKGILQTFKIIKI